jgi:hypothetical protein
MSLSKGLFDSDPGKTIIVHYDVFLLLIASTDATRNGFL